MSSDKNLIAERYVLALFELASEENQHDAVKQDMLNLKAALHESGELRKLLENPVITRDQSEKAIDAVLSVMKASDITRKFFALLARQRRLPVAEAAADKYLALLAESRGELTVEVTSAEALSKEQLATLNAALVKTTGKKVEMETSVDPTLIGGIQLRIGSQMLDNSISAKLERLRQTLDKAA